jgi:amino acid adenylation domain-containing protein
MDSADSTLRDQVLQLPSAQRAAVVERLALARRLPRLEPVHPKRDAPFLHPLSFAQERLWVLEQLDPSRHAFNSRLALQLTGDLDVPALRASLRSILARHTALRARFLLVGDTPFQEILPADSMHLTCVELGEALPADRDGEAERLLRADTRRPFDLSAGLLIRGILVRLEGRDHLLIINVHHIAADGYSLSIFARELSILYEAYSSGRRPTLQTLPLQYTDFARWERERLRGRYLEGHIEFWREQLRNCPVVQLPSGDLPDRLPGGAVEEFTLDTAASEALVRLAQDSGLSLFMLLLAIFAVFLSRYSGLRDIVVGTIVQNRRHPDLEGVIGLFTNVLPLRVPVHPNHRFREHLRAVRELALQAYAHQDVPFERIVEEVKAARNGVQQPFTDVMLSILAEISALRMGELSIKLFPDAAGLPRYEFFLVMGKTAQGLAGYLHYRTDKYAPAVISQMMRHWCTLLNEVAANPERRLKDFPMLTARESNQIASRRNRTRQPFPQQLTVTDLVELVAERSPDRLAIQCGTHHISYGELIRRSANIARSLRILGVDTDVPVALSLERSIDMVLAMLAVLKSGGAYVPLDTDHPAKRSAFILQDSQVRLVLTSPALRARVESLSGARCLTLEDLGKGEPGPKPQERNGARPASAAYIIYTSGSTGNPKGAVVTHRSLTNMVAALGELLGLNPEDAVAALATTTFDISTVELLLPLTLGASVVLAKSLIGRDPEELHDLFARRPLTVAQATPSGWRLLLSAGAVPHRHMRLIVGGERLARDLAADLSESGAEVWNGYGPTEATVYSTFSKVSAHDEAPPIGKPVANVRVLVLDEDMRIVPDGVTGELYVGGEGVSRGYWRRPDLTAERFVPDPLSEIPGARLYRTGDLARWRHDDQLEFLGRVDTQIKLRGYRIETDEIAAIVRSYPGIQDCVVVARETGTEPELVTYVVGEVDRAALRRHLQSYLPDYMVPSLFMQLPALPLLPSGKVDRRALPVPDRQSGQPTLAPATPIEFQLAEMWKNVLGVPSVGADENFFELGGNSLLAVKMIVRARDAFGVEVPFRALFETQTIQGLAARIEGLHHSGLGYSPPIVKRGARPTDIPLSFAQERLWIADQVAPGNPVYTLAGAVALEGRVDVNALLSSLREVVRRHEALRTAFPQRNGRPVQAIQAAVTASIELVTTFDLLSENDREERSIAYLDAEASKPFDLAHGPLFRARVIRVRDDLYFLMLAMHHMVVDGWSLALITREISLVYAAFVDSLPSPLAEPPLQFADYSLCQREWIQGPVLDRHRQYWSVALRQPRAFEFPPDRLRPRVATFRGDKIAFKIAPALSAELRQLSNREKVTLFVLLLAAWKAVLHHHTGATDILIGAPVANRGWRNSENIVGCFMNTLLLRTAVTGVLSFRELVHRVADVYADAFEFQELPYERMLDSGLPAFPDAPGNLLRSMFVFHNEARADLSFGAIKVTPILLKQRTAKVDLTIDIWEEAGAFAAVIEYSADLYDRLSISRLGEDFAALLGRLVANPDSRLEELDPVLADAGISSLRGSFAEFDQVPLL